MNFIDSWAFVEKIKKMIYRRNNKTCSSQPPKCLRYLCVFLHISRAHIQFAQIKFCWFWNLFCVLFEGSYPYIIAWCPWSASILSYTILIVFRSSENSFSAVSRIGRCAHQVYASVFTWIKRFRFSLPALYCFCEMAENRKFHWKKPILK